MKRKLALATAAVLTISTLGGCGGGKEDTSSGTLPDLDGRYEVDENVPAYQLDTKEDNKLVWYVNADWWNTDWGNDVVTKKIQEDLNLEIEFVTGDDTKLNTYFAGEDLPDIITVFDANSSIANSASQWAVMSIISVMCCA